MSVQAHYWRADSLGQSGNAAAAQDEYAAVIRLAPKDPLAAWANYSLGILKENQANTRSRHGAGEVRYRV